MRTFRLTMTIPHSTKSASSLIRPQGHRTVAQQIADAVREFANRRGISQWAVEYDVQALGRV